jgi:hypothetical protein
MRRTTLAALATVAFTSAGFLPADEPKASKVEPSTATTVDQRRHVRMRALAESYRVYCDPLAERPAVLRSEPIFRWTNPERAAIAGDLYLWTDHGRPHATIGIWTYDDVQDSHELQSLAAGPFKAVGTGQPDWTPGVAAVEYRPVATDIEFSRSAPLRLGQLRQLAKDRFSARMVKDSGETVPLRLLPQPIFRYDELPEGVTDGAMFSFANGTDPEVLLILELLQEGEKLVPYYAFGASTSVRADGSFDGQPVWNNDREWVRGTFVMYLLGHPDM